MPTKIEWVKNEDGSRGKTWNPVTGCTKVSEGCRNCYAERMSKRLAGRCGYSSERPFDVTLHQERLIQPLRWTKPSMVFVCSMGDLFHDDVPDEYIDKVFGIILACQVLYNIGPHVFQVLTKRPHRMNNYLSRDPSDLIRLWSHAVDYLVLVEKGDEYFSEVVGYLTWNVWGKDRRLKIEGPGPFSCTGEVFPLPNVWLGVSVEDQSTADDRIPVLLDTPAEVRFVSYEPAIAPVDFTSVQKDGEVEINVLNGDHGVTRPLQGRSQRNIDWLIMGGESGPGARPMHPDWARSARDQCFDAGVPFFFKQWGEWSQIYDRDVDDPDWRNLPGKQRGQRYLNLAGCMGFHGERVIAVRRVGKKAAGRELDGQVWDQMPEVTR